MWTSAMNPVPPNFIMSSKDLIEKSLLDHGGFGQVYLCYHKTLGQVVRKTLYTGPPLNEQRRNVLLEEGIQMNRLSHHRIVKLTGVILEPGAYSLVLEVIPTETLLTVMDRVNGPLPVSVKGRIILEILEGMVYLAKNDVTHKDLKPENILLDTDFHVKIADVGLASCQTWSKLTKLNPCGPKGSTLRYLAPEHLGSINTRSTEKSDVYSFAMVTWVVLTGTEPFRDAVNGDQVCQFVLLGRRPDESLIPPGTPIYIMKLMRDCWHPHPSLRPSFADSYKSFQGFYSKELENTVERDLPDLMTEPDGPGGVEDKLRSLSLDIPLVQGPLDGASMDISSLQPSKQSLGPIEADAACFGLDQKQVFHKPGGLPYPGSCSDTSSRWGAGASMSSVQPCRNKEAEPVTPGIAQPKLSAVAPQGAHRSSSVGKASSHQRHCPPFQRNQSYPGPSHVDLGGHNLSAAAPASSANPLRRSENAIFIENAKWIQIGNNNKLIIESDGLNESSFQPSVPNSSKLKELLVLYEDNRVNLEHLDVLRAGVSTNWKQVARKLGLSEVEVDTIAHDYGREGLRELVHQMLERFQMRQGLAGITVGSLCRWLRGLVQESLILQLLQTCKGSAST